MEMSNIYRIRAHQNDTIINLDNINTIILKNNIVEFSFINSDFTVTYDNDKKAKESYEQIFTYWDS